MYLDQPERLYIFGIGIPVLAIIVVITTYLQSKLMTPAGQPGEQGAQMTKAMNLYMPFLMGYLALTFASGLSLYFVASNLFTIGQYAAMGKLHLDNLSDLLPFNLKAAEKQPENRKLSAQKQNPAQKKTSAEKKVTGGKNGKKRTPDKVSGRQK
jgi:YidC/Oxa1 family membrane protein insertase